MNDERHTGSICESKNPQKRHSYSTGAFWAKGIELRELFPKNMKILMAFAMKGEVGVSYAIKVSFHSFA